MNTRKTDENDERSETYTTDRVVHGADGRTYTVPEFAPPRVRVDKHGRPELFMNPGIFGGRARPSATTKPKPLPKKTPRAAKTAQASKDADATPTDQAFDQTAASAVTEATS